MADDEEDQRALHARIFGDDDDDDDDDAPVPEKSRKRIQKSKPSSSKKRRSAPDAEHLAAEGVRLEAESEARRREGGGGGNEDDPDDDSVDGDEAIEEGGKKDMNRHFQKSRSGKKEYKREQLNEDVHDMISKMEAAADADADALSKDPPEPAVEKARMMPAVTDFMRKRHYHEAMVDNGFLSTVARWLEPTAGGLVNLTVRTGLLKSLQLIEADDTLVGALRSSKIGVYVKLLSMHRKETDDNKRMARGLVEKWSRPIFGSSASFRAQDVEEVMPKYDARELSAQVETDVAKDIQQNPNAYAEREVKSSGMVTAKGTVVPRPLGMDFHAQPASSAKPMASNKYTKDGSKGKLVERFTNSKKAKAGQRQAATLSVEGRTLDRV